MAGILFVCAKCPFQSSGGKAFEDHLDSDHYLDKAHWCKLCGTLFSKNLLREHLESQNCQFTYHLPCGSEGCEFTSLDPACFISHQKDSHRSAQVLHCKYCRKFFTLAVNLIAHIQSECLNRPSPNVFYKAISRSLEEALPAPDVSSSSATVSKRTVSQKSTSKENAVTSSYTNDKVSRCPQNNNIDQPDLEVLGDSFDVNMDSDPNDPAFIPNKRFKNHRDDKIKTKKKRRICSSSIDTPNSLFKKENDKHLSKAMNTSITDWNHWRETVKGYSNLVNHLLPGNICHFLKCMEKNCGFSCDNKSDFLNHVKKHRGAKLTCCYCFLRMADPNSFIKHIFEEHGQRKYQCSNCLYRACSKNHVKMHQKGIRRCKDSTILVCKKLCGSVQSPVIKKEEVPKSYKSYNCCVSGCDFSTPISSEFQEHCRNVHSCVTIFKCCYCIFKSSIFEELMDHFKLHCMYKYQCSYCSFGAEEADFVLQHLCLNHADKDLKIFSRLALAPTHFVNEHNISDTVTSVPEAGQLPFITNNSMTGMEASTTHVRIKKEIEPAEEDNQVLMEPISLKTTRQTGDIKPIQNNTEVPIPSPSNVDPTLNHSPEETIAKLNGCNKTLLISLEHCDLSTNISTGSQEAVLKTIDLTTDSDSDDQLIFEGFNSGLDNTDEEEAANGKNDKENGCVGNLQELDPANVSSVQQTGKANGRNDKENCCVGNLQGLDPANVSSVQQTSNLLEIRSGTNSNEPVIAVSAESCESVLINASDSINVGNNDETSCRENVQELNPTKIYSVQQILKFTEVVSKTSCSELPISNYDSDSNITKDEISNDDKSNCKENPTKVSKGSQIPELIEVSSGSEDIDQFKNGQSNELLAFSGDCGSNLSNSHSSIDNVRNDNSSCSLTSVPNITSSMSQECASQRPRFKATARKSTSKPPRHFKATARKSISKPVRMQETNPVPKPTTGYGSKPSPINLDKIFLMANPLGNNVRLNAFYFKKMFVKEIRVMVKDCRNLFLNM